MFDQLLQSLDTISIIIFGIFFLLLGYRPPWWWRKNTDIHKGLSTIPGPTAIPFFGSSWLFTFGGYKLNKLHEFYQEMHKKYGPIMKEEALWNIPVINLFERRDIEKVLKTSGRYPLRPPTEAISYYRKSRPDRYVSIGLTNEQGQIFFNKFLVKNRISNLVFNNRKKQIRKTT